MSANDYQVGGDHYKQAPGVPQHWDLSIMYQWDGFQHCITKYVMRWKTKYKEPEKKLEDLKKAAHMLQKYIENYEKFLQVTPAEPTNNILRKWEDGRPSYTSNEQFQCEGGYGDGFILYKCNYCKEVLKVRGLWEALEAHPQCPTHAAAGLAPPAPPEGAA